MIMTGKEIVLYSVILVLGLCFAIVYANDPNSMPAGFSGPPPSIEYLVKVDKDTVRGTYSVDYDKTKLEEQLRAVNMRITAFEKKKADIEKKLAVLDQ